MLDGAYLADRGFRCDGAKRVAQHFGENFLRRWKIGAECQQLQPRFTIGLLAEQQQLTELIGNLVASDVFAAGRNGTI